MWQKNSGKSETEILQNQFTTYLATAIQRRRSEYIQQAARLQQVEHMMETIYFDQGYDREEDLFYGLPLFMQLEDSVLLHALKEIDERERHIFLSRVLDGRSFESLAEEMGMGYKGVAAVYYRTIQKIKKKMKEMGK
ncbi:MAG: sigma-70 family RNA polymerase sigma factor [Ruminococcus flavefaciens]|nr:sigma-70 family RNA polymerase sigma factor [Ruminococcus flavefaciens]